jgi:predicted Zn-dependent protease
MTTRRAFDSWVLASFLVGCGGGAATSDKPVIEIVVARDGAGPPAIVTTTPPPKTARDLGFEECVAKLREGKLDDAASQERTPAGERESYAAAIAAERSGDLDTARRGYLKLIQTTPKSRFVPLTYLAFGELFFRDAATDPTKWELAEQSFVEVLKYPPPDNAAFAFASMRLGQVARAKGDMLRALSSSMKAVEAAKATSEPCQRVFADVARIDVIDAYVEAGRPEAAFSFFQRLADPDRHGALANDLLERLLLGYVARDRGREALALIDDLSQRSPTPSFCATARSALDRLRGKAGLSAQDLAARESTLGACCAASP